MHLPRSSPPLRGAALRLTVRLAAIPWIRRLLVAKVLRDARLPEMPDPDQPERP